MFKSKNNQVYHAISAVNLNPLAVAPRQWTAIVLLPSCIVVATVQMKYICMSEKYLYHYSTVRTSHSTICPRSNSATILAQGQIGLPPDQTSNCNCIKTRTRSQVVGLHCTQGVYSLTSFTHVGVCEFNFSVNLIQQIAINFLSSRYCRLWTASFVACIVLV
jgi:hypothetical protein